MTAGRLCTRAVVTASPGETVRAAARRMAENDMGTLVVVGDDPDRPIGVVTDRDITIRCIAKGWDPDAMAISKVMSTPVHTVGEDAPLEDALSKMAISGVRRIVVTDEKKLMVGMLSLDDVLDALSLDANSICRLVEKQNPRIPL